MRPDNRGRALGISLVVHGLVAWGLWEHAPRDRPAPEESVTVLPFVISPRPQALVAMPATVAPGMRGARRSPARRVARLVAAPVATASGGDLIIASGDGQGVEAGGDLGLPGRRLEMAGRVVAGGVESGEAGAARGLRYLSLGEATGLRTYDVFPRLPLSSWPGPRPYVVVIDLCVSAEGQVTEAALLTGRSARLDPVVLRAVRTWRYRPRVIGGRAEAFCHVVTILYEM
jgi:hypothetical protein